MLGGWILRLSAFVNTFVSTSCEAEAFSDYGIRIWKSRMEKKNPSAKQHTEHLSKGRNSFFPQHCPALPCPLQSLAKYVFWTPCSTQCKQHSPNSWGREWDCHDDGKQHLSSSLTPLAGLQDPVRRMTWQHSWAPLWWPDKQVGDCLQNLYLTKHRASERSLKWRKPERSLEPCTCSCPTHCHCINPDLQHWAAAPGSPWNWFPDFPTTISLLEDRQQKTALSSSLFLSIPTPWSQSLFHSTLSIFMCFALFWHQLMPSTLVCNLVTGICWHEGYLSYKKS